MKESSLLQSFFTFLGAEDLIERSCLVMTPSSFAPYKLIADFLRSTRLCPQVFLPFVGTIVDHIVRSTNLRGQEYRVLNYRSGDWNIGGSVEDLLRAGMGSCVFLPFNASYPLSVALSPAEWQVLLDICIRRRHLIWLDVNFFGLCESVEADAAALRAILHSSPCVVSCSLQRSFGLHLQDAGCVICVCESPKEAANVRQTLQRCASELWGAEPLFMKAVVTRVLSDSSLREKWYGLE